MMFGRVGVVAALFAAFVLGTACTSSDAAKQHPSEPAARAATPDAGVLEGLKKFPQSTYHSIEEAAAAAGYHIPKPSIDYPLANNNTFLQGHPAAGGVPLSRSRYRLPAQPGESIELDVGPPDVWRGDSTWTRGERMTVGGKDGWLDTDGDGGLFFAWRCDTPAAQALWCVVLGATSTGRDNFLSFVATLN